MKNAFFHGGLIIFASAFLAAILMYPVDSSIPDRDPSELKPGGEGSVPIRPSASFMLPAANLPQTEKSQFHAGKALAHQPWIKAPTATDARDGLGPLYNARACLACHINGGRGTMPADNTQLLFTNFVRLSLPGYDPVLGVIAEPNYGDQLQSQSTALAHQLRTQQELHYDEQDVRPEAYVFISWINSTFTYPDGEVIQLRKPELDIRNLGYGPLHETTLTSLRNAPPIHGVGLLELIPQIEIDAQADEQDTNNDGISGRVNTVWDFENNRAVAGRFGLKANRATLRIQVAAALQGDMGISNPVFPQQPCSEKQIQCMQAITGNDQQGVEISAQLLDLIVDFNRNIGVPERRQADHPMVVEGRRLFYTSQCNACHTPHYLTAHSESYPHLSQQLIWPYTDLLLHDMGPGLADFRSDYSANGYEWRTAPLWGVGLSESVNASKQFLHDGRARSIEEAIIWHGGEAERSKQIFAALNKQQRNALIAFVKSL